MPRLLRGERYAKDPRASRSFPDFLVNRLPYLSYAEAMSFYAEWIPRMKPPDVSLLGCNDRFFLLTGLLNRVDMIHPWLYERAREVEAEPDGYLDLWARAHGKAVDTDEPVPTPSGWKKHGELEVGDRVFGPDGKPTRVVWRTPVFTDAKCYRVTFCDGYSVVVSGEHLWTVNLPSRARVNGTNERKKWKTVTVDTEELRQHVETAKRVPSRRFPAIPVARPVQYPAVSLPIDPYVLGVWIGDGHASAAAITTSWEDWPHFKHELEAAGHTVTVAYDRGTCLGYRVDVRDRTHCIRGHDLTEPGAVYVPPNGTVRQCRKCKAALQRHVKYGAPMPPRIQTLAERLREIGAIVHGKKVEKRIPPIYLHAAEHQRWALLQGLMDTDGHCHKDHSQCQFVTVSENLAEDVFELCQSLGLKPTKRRQSLLYKGKRRYFWQVQFLGRADHPPFRLPRKVARCTDDPKPAVRMVKSVEPVPCRPVSCIQVDRPDGLYLIGRHFVTTHNSSWITFAGSIQEIICDPEITIGIFGNTKEISRPFLSQIKDELEGNEELKGYYADVLWANPRKESPSWSVERGIIVKRASNPKEATVEAHGLIDAMPTGRHFKLMIFDDIITEKNVSNPEQIKKATERVELADNLGVGEHTRKQFAGTRYHFGDSYAHLMEHGVVTPRVYPATDDGTLNGNPVFLSPKAWEDRKKAQRSTIAAQMLQNPIAGQENMFRTKWLQPYWVRPVMLNVYILGDPSRGRSKTSDRTALVAIGIDTTGNKFVLDGYCHRMALSERWQRLRDLHRKWSNAPGVQLVKVGYERYGSQSDDEYFQERMRLEGVRFEIEELNWTGERGLESKKHRVERLEPDFRNGHFFVPGKVWHAGVEGGVARWWIEEGSEEIHYEALPAPHRLERQVRLTGELWRLFDPIRRIDEDGNIYDLTRVFFEELAFFPFSPRDDLIDAVSRIYDLEPTPAVRNEVVHVEDYVDA